MSLLHWVLFSLSGPRALLWQPPLFLLLYKFPSPFCYPTDMLPGNNRKIQTSVSLQVRSRAWIKWNCSSICYLASHINTYPLSFSAKRKRWQGQTPLPTGGRQHEETLRFCTPGKECWENKEKEVMEWRKGLWISSREKPFSIYTIAAFQNKSMIVGCSNCQL